MTHDSTPPALSDRDLVISRLVAAAREDVFTAFTGQWPAWWGPHGTTTPRGEIDVRAGGVLRLVLRTADGTEYPTRAVFLEVTPPQRIVFTDAFDRDWRPAGDPSFTTIVTFEAAGLHTRITVRALHWTPARRAEHERLGFFPGWHESLERLAALLAEKGVVAVNSCPGPSVTRP